MMIHGQRGNGFSLSISINVVCKEYTVYMSRLAQLVERVTSNDEVSRSSRLEGINRAVALASFVAGFRQPRGKAKE